jgi:hypothetical protein
MTALVVTVGLIVWICVEIWMHVSYWLALVVGSWIGFAIFWFIYNCGNKTQKDKWFDVVILLPMAPFAWLFGHLNYFFQEKLGLW